MTDSNMEIFLPILLLLEVITDLSSSIFIIVSLSLTGFQRTNNAPLNRILISLNVSNVLYTIFTTAYLFTSSLWSDIYSVRSVFYFISYMTLYSITSSSWLTATLCFFYFIKIIPSRPGVLVNIKNNIGAFVLRFILMAETISIIGSSSSILISIQYSSGINSTINEVKAEEIMGKQKFYMNMILTVNALPIIVVILTTVVSTWLLREYNSQMKKKNGTLANTNVKNYWSAVQTMTGLLIFYLFLILALIFSILRIFAERSAGYWICFMLLLSFPTGQSIFLIYGNPKLKQILKNLFTSLTCRDSGK